LKKSAAYVFLVFLFLIFLQYGTAPVYHFPPAIPFHGDSLFNPYANLNGKWLKANFHAHGNVWGGMTNGANSTEHVVEQYRRMGYDIVGISNYQSIYKRDNSDSSLIANYEHGYGLMKNHQLNINVREVKWIDFILPQTLNQKQYVLNCLADSGVVVAIAHPRLRDAYSLADMERLTNYTCMEVVSHFRQSQGHWDAALSAGRYPWILGNDDTHNADDMGQTGVFWTMVNTSSKQVADIVQALRSGHTYAVVGTNGKMDVWLKNVHVSGDEMVIECEPNAALIELIGQGGKVLVRNSNCASASYRFTIEDSYVRVQITSGTNKLYLNPVLRYDGKSLPTYSASINLPASIGLWALALIVFVVIARKTLSWTKKAVPK
jgi:hypothetical protein